MNGISKTQREIYDKLRGMSGEEVVDILTDFLGMQILTDDLAEHLVDEGYADESDFSELFLEEEDEEEEDC